MRFCHGAARDGGQGVPRIGGQKETYLALLFMASSRVIDRATSARHVKRSVNLNSSRIPVKQKPSDG
jgi:hypothetical protein